MPKKARELERIIRKEGWYFIGQEGSHRHYAHPTKPGKITIPFHSKDVSKAVENNVLKQAGIRK